MRVNKTRLLFKGLDDSRLYSFSWWVDVMVAYRAHVPTVLVQVQDPPRARSVLCISLHRLRANKDSLGFYGVGHGNVAKLV